MSITATAARAASRLQGPRAKVVPNCFKVIQPQPGPQMAFLASKADIAIIGGSAGGGKTMACLLCAMRHRKNGLFNAIVFRRTGTMIRGAGGLWQKTTEFMPAFGYTGSRHEMRWVHDSGSVLKCNHMEHEGDEMDHQGAEIPLVIFEELTQFTEAQFWFMNSRLRSMSGVPGRIRASCNPDPDSFVRKLIAWWIGDDGYAIEERSGILRWFVRQGTSDVDEQLVWAGSREELTEKYGEDSEPTSLTFIRSKLEDNKILLDKDPSYKRALNRLPYVLRLRYGAGNWDVKPSAGMVFKAEWFTIVDDLPSTHRTVIRQWDRAASLPTDSYPDPDYTAGIKVSVGADGIFYVESVFQFRALAGDVESAIHECARFDGQACVVGLAKEGGSVGKADVVHTTKALAGFSIIYAEELKDKVTRANATSVQASHGRIRILKGGWNGKFLAELVAFPDGKHDDVVDALVHAINWLTSTNTAPITEEQFAFGNSFLGIDVADFEKPVE